MPSTPEYGQWHDDSKLTFRGSTVEGVNEATPRLPLGPHLEIWFGNTITLPQFQGRWGSSRFVFVAGRLQQNVRWLIVKIFSLKDELV